MTDRIFIPCSPDAAATPRECHDPACERDIKALMDQCADMFEEIERLRGAAQPPINLHWLVDWAHLYATEGNSWISKISADKLIALAAREPTQADANRLSTESLTSLVSSTQSKSDGRIYAEVSQRDASPDELAVLNEAINVAMSSPAIPPGEIDGLYGRIPSKLQKLVRKIADAPNYDYAAMELLDAFEIEWRKPG